MTESDCRHDQGYCRSAFGSPCNEWSQAAHKMAVSLLSPLPDPWRPYIQDILVEFGREVERQTEARVRAESAHIIRRLRKALAYYAEPEVGWAEIEHANAYEESRDLVPDDEEELRETAPQEQL